MSPIQPFRLRLYWPVGLVLIAGLGISGWLGLRLHRQAVELDRLRLQRIAETVRDRLHTKLQTTDLIMRHAQDYFGSQETITDGMFREWCRKYGWSVTAPWMHGMALYTNLNAGAWHGVVPPDPATWREADFRAFDDFAKQTPVNLKHAFGYSHDTTQRWPTNYNAELRLATAYQSFAGAIPANTPQTTGRQIVVEHEGGASEYGATVSVPIYEVRRDELRDLIAGPAPKSQVHIYNWNLCRGVLLAPIDYVTLESLIWSDGSKEVGVEIFASPKPRLEAWLNATDHPPHALDSAFKPYLSVKIPWNLYNGHWTLFVYTLPAFEAGSPRYMARLTFAAGTAMTLLATALVGLALRTRNRQETLTGQIREARDALAAAEQHRQALSHDLHDNTVQALYAIQLGLNHTSHKLETDPGSARSDLSTVCAELDVVIAEVRRFITAEAGEEKAADLSGVLRALVERARVGTTARLDLRCDPDASERLSGNQAVQLANIAREALSNSLRHARPQLVQIALRSEAEAVCLEVSDDGIGFDPQSQGRRGVGLTSMSARAQESGGTLEIQSSPGRGTRVVARVPASPAEPAEADGSQDDPDES